MTTKEWKNWVDWYKSFEEELSNKIPENIRIKNMELINNKKVPLYKRGLLVSEAVKEIIEEISNG